MPKSKARRKKQPKRVLALPDLEQAKMAVLNSLTSASGQRTYDHAIREFVAWYCSEPRLAFNRTVVLRYRIHLEQRGYAPATINLRLAAVRRIAYEAADAGLLSPELAAGIRRVKGMRRIGVRLGNWLTPEQGRRLLECAVPSTVRELRDHAMVAMLIGCGLRRAELLALRLESIQQREEHWVIADLVGKASHVRTVPIPTWVKTAVDAWTTAAVITEGPVFRAINRAGRVWGEGMSPKVLWDVVRTAAARAGIDKLAPHDLRRTCARLCHLAGGELDQIQFLLGHVSIQTTERYLGCKQKLRIAVNDRLGIEPDAVDRDHSQGGCFNPPWATTHYSVVVMPAYLRIAVKTALAEGADHSAGTVGAEVIVLDSRPADAEGFDPRYC
jgi:integrase